MTAQNKLSVRSLSATRGRRPVLEDVDLDASSGQVIQIMGANGSGKSTLLRIIAGLALPDHGSIYWNEADSNHLGRDAFRRASLYIGHKGGVADDQTAVENLELFQRVNAARSTRTPQEALEKIGYNAALDVFAAKTSAGQRQRVALAKLLLVQAPLWLLDEPFTALDKDGKALLETFLAEHCQNGGIAVIATHQPISLPAEQVKNFLLD